MRFRGALSNFFIYCCLSADAFIQIQIYSDSSCTQQNYAVLGGTQNSGVCTSGNFYDATAQSVGQNTWNIFTCASLTSGSSTWTAIVYQPSAISSGGACQGAAGITANGVGSACTALNPGGNYYNYYVKVLCDYGQPTVSPTLPATTKPKLAKATKGPKLAKSTKGPKLAEATKGPKLAEATNAPIKKKL